MAVALEKGLQILVWHEDKVPLYRSDKRARVDLPKDGAELRPLACGEPIASRLHALDEGIQDHEHGLTSRPELAPDRRDWRHEAGYSFISQGPGDAQRGLVDFATPQLQE